jgi:hypothetical protein
MINRVLIAIVICLLLPLSASSGQNGQAPSIAIVSVPLANVRQDTEPKSPIVTQVLLGDEVRILEKQEYRYRISIPAQGNAEGWIHQEALLLPRDGGQAYLSSERQRVVITAPKTKALILDKLGNHNVSLYAGTRLPVVKTTAEGATVQFPDRTLAVLNPPTRHRPDRGTLSPGPSRPKRSSRCKTLQRSKASRGGMTIQDRYQRPDPHRIPRPRHLRGQNIRGDREKI